MTATGERRVGRPIGWRRASQTHAQGEGREDARQRAERRLDRREAMAHGDRQGGVTPLVRLVGSRDRGRPREGRTPQ